MTYSSIFFFLFFSFNVTSFYFLIFFTVSFHFWSPITLMLSLYGVPLPTFLYYFLSILFPLFLLFLFYFSYSFSLFFLTFFSFFNSELLRTATSDLWYNLTLTTSDKRIYQNSCWIYYSFPFFSFFFLHRHELRSVSHKII